MYKTESGNSTYHGWKIDVVTDAHGVWFRCYHPALPDYCNDGCSYPDYESAFVAACGFVDREVAVLALIDVVQEWWANRVISDEEYWNLTRFDEWL